MWNGCCKANILDEWALCVRWLMWFVISAIPMCHYGSYLNNWIISGGVFQLEVGDDAAPGDIHALHVCRRTQILPLLVNCGNESMACTICIVISSSSPKATDVTQTLPDLLCVFSMHDEWIIISLLYLGQFVNRTIHAPLPLKLQIDLLFALNVWESHSSHFHLLLSCVRNSKLNQWNLFRFLNRFAQAQKKDITPVSGC